MESGLSKKKRRSLRLKDFDYGQPGIYYVTIVTFHRQSLFGTISDNTMVINDKGKFAGQCWKEIPDHFQNTELLTWIVMPNHIHGLIQLLDDSYGTQPVESRRARHGVPLPISGEAFGSPTVNTLPTIIRSYKSAVSRLINRSKSLEDHHPVWQRNYYEHIVRSEEELFEIGQYIETNAATWRSDKEFLN